MTFLVNIGTFISTKKKICVQSKNRIWNGETITTGHRKYFVETNSTKSSNILPGTAYHPTIHRTWNLRTNFAKTFIAEMVSTYKNIPATKFLGSGTRF